MDYKAIFEGHEFIVNGITWKTAVDNVPGASAAHTDRVLFDLVFTRQDEPTHKRYLKLWGSNAGIHVENHGPKLVELCRTFLRNETMHAEIEAFMF